MDVVKANNRLVRTNWLLLGLGALFLIAWRMPAPGVLQDVVLMSLPTHMFAETFSIIVSMLVSALVFSRNTENRSGNPITLACAFFVVGLLDFAHTLSYGGMPDFVTPGSPDKSIYFWLVARYVAAIALFIAALQLWEKIPHLPNRYWSLLASIVLTAFFYWIGLYHLDAMPRTFIEGQGLTLFKIGAEYGIIAILLVPAIIFYAQAKKSYISTAGGLYAATVITILSELCFTLYANVTGLFILLGHIYKVIAYIYIFRALFVFVVRLPYQKLSESEQYNRALFENSSTGFAVCKMDGSLIDINQSFANIIGRSIEDTKKLTYWQITPEDYTNQEQRQLESLETKKYYGPYEKEYLHKDGHRIPVRLSGRLIERNGETLIWSSVEDVSALSKSQKSLAEAQRIAKLGSWELDLISNTVAWSDETYRIFGLDQHEFGASYEAFLEVVHPDDRDLVNSAYTESLENKTPYDLVHRLLLKDGTMKYVNAKCNTYYNTDGCPLRSIGTTQDITEQKLAADELSKYQHHLKELVDQRTADLKVAKEEAERANLAKSQFLSRMSHELRTPLNAILGFSQLLELDEGLNNEQQDSIREIHHGGEHLLELVNEVLDLAKIEAGGYEIISSQINMREILMECVALSAPLQNQYEVSLSVKNDGSVQTDVYANITRLKQIILNLISNACKYNHKGGSIEIECSNTAEGRIRLSVKDTGKGIAKKYHASIFEPFNRLEDEYSNVEGTGIGLTITKQLIEKMGGNISFESEKGKGSTFWIDLLPYNPDLNIADTQAT